MRTVIKHSYLKSQEAGLARARRHLRYLAFRSAEKERAFFSGEKSLVSRKEVEKAVERHHRRSGVVMHKLVLSPGANFEDMQSYVQEIMTSTGSAKGLDLEWYAVEHRNTDHWHVHVIVMPRDKRGYSVRFDKTDYKEIKVAGDRFLWRNNLLERKRYERQRVARNPHRSLHGLRQRVYARLGGSTKHFDKHDHSRLRAKQRAAAEEQRISRHQRKGAKERSLREWLKYGIGNLNHRRSRTKNAVNDKQLRHILEDTFKSGEKGKES